MKLNWILVVFAVVLGAAVARGADAAKGVPYTATVTGVVCGSCKAHVTVALQKLPGVKEVTFAKGEQEGTQKVMFSAASDQLAKEDVVKSLGEDAKHYTVLELEKKS